MKSAEVSFSELSVEMGDDEIIKYFYQTLDNIVYIHSKKIFHREIKGQNCLLVGRGWALSDFRYSKDNNSQNNKKQEPLLGQTGTYIPIL